MIYLLVGGAIIIGAISALLLVAHKRELDWRIEREESLYDREQHWGEGYDDHR